MTPYDGYLIALGAVAAYVLVLIALHRSGRLGPDRALSLFGPALMMKTKRGVAWLDRAGRFRRFWSVAGDLGLFLAGLAMVGILVVLGIDAVLALAIPASAAPQPSEALGIPGLNPIIPIGYGLIALVVGIVVHELMHGVIARSQKIGVKSVGVLWLVVPVGAFVEQDETEIETAGRRARGRVAAAGILANFGLTVVFFLALSLVISSSVAPRVDGVTIAYVVPGFPADNASLAAGDVLTSVNGTPIRSETDLFDALQNTSANETVPIAYYVPSSGQYVSATVRLTALSSYTHVATDSTKGFLGISPAFLSPSQFRSELIDPLRSPYGPLAGATYWLVLPLAGFEPVQGNLVSYYHVSGPLAVLGTGGFWILANSLYWLAWMNLLLGLSNALPLVPLDGGLLFRDFVASLAHRVKRSLDPAALERISGRAVAISSVLVIFLIAWQFIAPHL